MYKGNEESSVSISVGEMSRISCVLPNDSLEVFELPCTQLATPKSSLKRHVSDDASEGSTRSSEPSLKKRKVSFGASTALETSHNLIISRHECKSIWYSRQDLKAMKKEAKLSSAKLNVDDELFRAFSPDSRNTTNSEDEFDIAAKASHLHNSSIFEEQRGLERWSSSRNMLSRCVAIVQARTEVLLEQTNQSITGKSDPDHLAEAYRCASSPSARYARILGAADAILGNK